MEKWDIKKVLLIRFGKVGYYEGNNLAVKDFIFMKISYKKPQLILLQLIFIYNYIVTGEGGDFGNLRVSKRSSVEPKPLEKMSR